MPKFNNELSKNACIIISCNPAHKRLKQICNKHLELNYEDIHKKLVEIEKLLHEKLLYKKMEIKIGMAIKMSTNYAMAKIGVDNYDRLYQTSYVNCTVQSLYSFNKQMKKWFKKRWLFLFNKKTQEDKNDNDKTYI